MATKESNLPFGAQDLLRGGPTQAPLRYYVEAGGQLHEVRELTGEEKVSSTFRFEARFAVEIAEMPDPDALVKAEGAVVLMRDGMTVRRIDGIFTDVAVGASIRGVHEVELVLEPRLTLARFRKDLRVFRNKTVPQIVTETLSQIGVTPELRLSASYDKRPYCVEWRETDLDFVHRLLEDEGIFYYFLPGDVMVLGDSPAAYEPIASPVVPYRAASAMDRHVDAVTTIGKRAALTVGKVTLRDWNAEMPSLDMDVMADGPTPSGPEFYDYPGEYLTPGEGTRKAKLTSEAFGTNAKATVGRAHNPEICPGFSFRLIDAPVLTYNRGYAVLSVEHAYKRATSGPAAPQWLPGATGAFSVEFTALNDDVTYRPARTTFVPRILNPQTGIVTGPAGADDIYTDEYGRIKLHFHWDRRLPPDEDCSHWIPVLQDNTGSSSAIPRREWEMMVHFMEGDPDRPVVLGRVYNAEDRFPVPLPARKFCTSLKSLSTPTRDGTNEIQMDDEAGREAILIHAERDQNIVVANDKTETILYNENSLVRRNERITIGVNHTMTIGKDITPQITGDQTWSTGGNRTRQTADGENASIMGNRTKTIGATHMIRLDDSASTTAKNLTEQVGGVILEVSKKSNGTEVGQNGVRAVGGAVIELANENKAETTVKKRIETIGGVLFQKAKKEIKIKSGKTRFTKVGFMYSADAQKQLSLAGAEELSVLSATATHQGKTKVTLKVGRQSCSSRTASSRSRRGRQSPSR